LVAGWVGASWRLSTTTAINENGAASMILDSSSMNDARVSGTRRNSNGAAALRISRSCRTTASWPK
jgi:hypothetical protein